MNYELRMNHSTESGTVLQGMNCRDDDLSRLDGKRYGRNNYELRITNVMRFSLMGADGNAQMNTDKKGLEN